MTDWVTQDNTRMTLAYVSLDIQKVKFIPLCFSSIAKSAIQQELICFNVFKGGNPDLP